MPKQNKQFQIDELILENKSLKQEIALQKHLIDEQNKVIKLYLDKLKKEAQEMKKDMKKVVTKKEMKVADKKIVKDDKKRDEKMMKSCKKK